MVPNDSKAIAAALEDALVRVQKIVEADRKSVATTRGQSVAARDQGLAVLDALRQTADETLRTLRGRSADDADDSMTDPSEKLTNHSEALTDRSEA